jgi:tRNA(Ile)-lysidine synthase
MTQLETKLAAALRRFSIGSTDALVIAVSGGADSSSLLDALSRRTTRDSDAPQTLIVAHLNHGLRGEESDQDQDFVQSKAAALGLPFATERRNLQKTGSNLESIARAVRYDFLQTVAERFGARYVLTAHTHDDQAETIMMRLLRGSGPEGLRGIRAVRSLGSGVRVLRPLLEVTREEVLAHCAHDNVEYRTDSSNLSHDHLRNRVRSELLPLLRTYNPRSDEALVRLATIITEEDLFLAQYADELLSSLLGPPNAGADQAATPSLEVKSLQAFAPPIRVRVLRQWIKSVRGDLKRIDSTHLASLDRLIMTGQSGRKIELPNFWIVSCDFGLLTLKQKTGHDPTLPLRTPLQAGQPQRFGDYELELIRGVNGPKLPRNEEHAFLLESEQLDRLEIRRREPGDAYIPATGHRPIKLKTLLIRAQIPWSARDAHPVIVSSENHILWSPGLPIAREFSPPPGEHEYALITARKHTKT